MKQVHINGLLQNGSYYADGNTTVVAFRPGSIVAVLVITFNALPDPLVVVLNNGGTDALADVIGQELVSLLTEGLSNQNAAVALSDVEIEEATTTVETTIGTTTEATGPAMPETTPESTPDTTPGTSPETSPETSPATSPVTSPATSPVTPPITTPETTAASTTPELTCADDEFACDEGRCIDESAVCDFIPDCRVSRNDETEDLCEVSLLTDDISVTSRRNATLTIPDSYPSRTQDTPLDYILYRLTSPDNSYLLIDVVSLQSNGPDSIVTIGNGHDPVEIMKHLVLLGRAAEDVKWTSGLVYSECPQEDAVPCLRSSQCYLPSQICDNETHCQNGEDEQNCPNECVSCTTLWGGDIPVCLPLDWLCDGYQDCDDNLDESDCPTCFECPSGSFFDCVYDPEWVCDTYEDCNEGEDERNCPVFCPDGQFGCPWPDSVCIDETLICDFVPDCRVAGGDEAEEVCMVSQITDEIMVPFNEYKILRNPDSYPTRDVNTSSDYQLYKISSPPDSHLLIEVIRVVFDGTLSTVSVGSGLDPIEQIQIQCIKHHLGSEAYILLKGSEGIEMLVRVSAFECESYNATPCSRSNHCYLEDEICDGTVQCERSGEDEQGCGSPAPDPCHYCERYGTDDTCLPQQWLCDDYADCIDGSDESDCGTATEPPCFQCPSEPDCINLSYICDGVDDCLDGSDEVNCTTCFECPSGSRYDCVFDPNWVCDGSEDCNDGEDEIDCPDVCTGFVCETFFGNCLLEMYVCDGMPDCSDGTDELNCNVTEPPCFQCPSEPDCINLSFVCDGVDDCLDGFDEVNCTCPDDQYPCYFDDSICLDYTDVGCDGNYDCPGGTDEYNCTGCFACPGFSWCLLDLQVCDFYNDCPYGVDEAEDLCKHSEYISNIDIQVGVWTDFSEGFVRERTLDDRDTPASEFYDFTHYVFESPEGSTLFMEIQNFTMNLTGPLLDLVGVSTGYWTNPTDFETVLAFADGYGNLESYTYSTNFTLFLNTGYLLIAMPKSVAGIFNMTFRVSAVECESPESPCYLSLHCLDMEKDYCDGEVQCLDSGEDEYECEVERMNTDVKIRILGWRRKKRIDDECDGEVQCLDSGEDEYGCEDKNTWMEEKERIDDECDGDVQCLDSGEDEYGSTEPPCFQCPSQPDCINASYVCDGVNNCEDGSDEVNCKTCLEFACPTINPALGNCISNYWVCDELNDCVDGSDESNCDICPDGLYPCFFNESICYNYTAVGCDGNYDCPGGSDEYNCAGCFACNGSSSCLLDLQVCNFYNDCFGGEDETNELCRHTDFISESDIQVGVWTDFSEGFVRERTLDGRDTPASEFYDFTHYVFESPEGSTLFMEIQNLTVNLTGPLLELVGISAGFGTDPTDFYTALAYSDGYGYFSSYIVSTNFSLLDNVGYLFIAIPKSVAGTFNINFRVTAVECEYPEELCYGSLHCLDRIQETCDGEVQCLDSEEDEYGCEECFYGHNCFFENKCVQPRGICDNNGTYDCASGSDESQCPGCVPCNGTGWCPDDILVCDYWKDCPSGDDEAESLCNHTAFINEVNLAIGESVVINRSWLDGAYGDRDTPSSNFYNFTHYVFTSPPGTALFVEMQNITAQDDPGPLQYVFRVQAGTGTDPTSVENTVAYIFELDHSPWNFSIPDSVGYVLIAIPKGVQANVTFNVTVVDCQLPFIPCTGSPHCWEYKDRCDGETQCLYSSEDEHGCSDCFECEIIWIDDPCLPSEWRCDGFIDCSDESDELFCDQELPPFCCVNNAGNDSLCIDPSRVCDDIYDCVDLSDELSCATTPTTSSTISPDTSSPTSPTVSPDTSSPTSPTVSPVTSSPTSPTTIPSSTPTTTSSSPTDQCNEFSCQTADPVYGNCISNDSVCDFLTDCVDGSDEEDCDCFKCPNKDACLLDVYLCDFLVDCEPDGADEDFCRHSDYIRPRNVTTGEWITIEQRAGDPVEYRGTPASQRFYFYHYVFQADSAATLFVEVLNFTGTADHSLDYHPIVTAGAGEDPLSPLSEEAYFDTFGSVESISSTKNFTLESSTGYVLLNFPTNTEAYVRFRVTAVACVDGDSTYCIGSPHCYDLVTECRDGTVQCLYTGEDEDLDTACPGP
nr:uncharacterized protein LOC129267057 [Lytechinus pictus]